MKLKVLFTSFCIFFVGGIAAGKVVSNPKPVAALLERVGSNGASQLILSELDSKISGETFVITSKGNKPCIKASTMSALTCGIGWYLNHYAKVNISWNCPKVDLSSVDLPLPMSDEVHSSSADYRYYLNYCTFSYSMSTWTWERWQQEIDWMALHGVNMPLQIVGLEVVWRNMLRDEYGYSDSEVNDFIAGPCFMAWFGMNNLEGWGGPNPEWWYTRQEQLCKQINARMHELGIEPVLPGYSGMVPSNFTNKTGISAINQGKWCNFRRPYILNPNAAEFAGVAKNYYKHLQRVMGKSDYYSMDPFHEGANTENIDVGKAYARIYEQMNAANKRAKWVIQQWQWSDEQYKVLDNVPVGRLIVLDLFSDGKPNLSAYKEHDAVYCILPNFGGRTGIMGRFDKVIREYFNARDSLGTLRGVGAAPESIEQVSVLYDEIFELPWLETKPDGSKWLEEYTKRRYGTHNADAIAAWQLLRTTVLNCPTALQGPQEAVTCARPSWTVDRVSTWGGSALFYDAKATATAAKLMLNANLNSENYLYDLVDVTRQALTDHANVLMTKLSAAKESGDSITLADLESRFIALIKDIDRLLSTNRNFMLGKWTNMARQIADEVPETSDADKDWLELNNARMLITTWGERENSEDSGLHDYSYRQCAGMLNDFYAMRWRKFFNSESVDWFETERAWALDGSKKYTDKPQGDSKEVANELINRYFSDY